MGERLMDGRLAARIVIYTMAFLVVALGLPRLLRSPADYYTLQGSLVVEQRGRRALMGAGHFPEGGLFMIGFLTVGVLLVLWRPREAPGAPAR